VELSGFGQQVHKRLPAQPDGRELHELANALGVSHMELLRSAEDE